MPPKTKAPAIAPTTPNNPSAKPQASNGVITDTSAPPLGVNVNRKKQKRRAKAAAARQASGRDQQGSGVGHGLAAADYANGYIPASQAYADASHGLNPDLHYDHPDYADVDFDPAEDGEFAYSDDEHPYAYDPAFGTLGHGASANGTSSAAAKKKKRKKKGKKNEQDESPHDDLAAPTLSRQGSYAPPPPPPPPLPISDDALRTVQRKINKDPIWNNSSQEERSRIKEFWLSLGEEDRKSLVKIEKEAVLRKMKEQQKHSCSCTVCGRKRTAIEEELEVLYDAYYEELEQFANHNQQLPDPDSKQLPHPASRQLSDRLPRLVNPRKTSSGRVQELPDNEGESAEEAEDDEDEYSDDGYMDDYSEDDTDDVPPQAATDFFTFGNSLTVKGGILTVADDLLKNDGQKFIDMMEQLAERRMQREEEAQYAPYMSHAGLPSQHSHAGHDHGPPPEEDEFEEDEDEEYDSEEAEYDEEDEMVRSRSPPRQPSGVVEKTSVGAALMNPQDTMTEEQRMEEGRRMFQIFAARMFEQRVLTAYREKVARERQEKLIEELEAESQTQTQRDAKKARDAEKKKAKKQLQKQAKAEEKARKDKEKADQEAAVKAAEEKKQEEARKKRDEQKKKKEAERKALEEERLKKEAEKQKRQEAEREKQQEAERKTREAREEKKRRENAKKRELEEKEVQEKETREKKAADEKEARDKEEAAKIAREATEKKQREEQTVAATAETAKTVQSAETAGQAKRPSLPAVVALPPTLKSRSSNIDHHSPQPKVATPALPKAPTPSRPRDISGRSSQNATPQSPEPASYFKPTTSPKTASSQVSGHSSIPSSKEASQQHSAPLTQPISPMHSVAPPPGMTQHHGVPFGPIPPMGNVHGFSANQSHMAQGIANRMPQSQHMPMYQQPHGPPLSQPRGSFMPPTPGTAPPPGMSAPGIPAHSRGFAPDSAPGFPPPLASPTAAGPIQPPLTSAHDSSRSHSRQHSGSHEMSPFESQLPPTSAQPIGRPAPIKRPASTKPHESIEGKDSGADVDDLSRHLGSSALLDDNDEPLPAGGAENRRPSAAPGMPSAAGHPGSIGSPLDSVHSPFSTAGRSDTWSRTPASHFGFPGMPTSASSVSATGWGSAPQSATTPGGWSSNRASSFQIPSTHNPYGHHHRAGGNPRPVTVRLLACQACKVLSAQQQPPSLDGGFHDFTEVLRKADGLRPMHEAPVQPSELRNILDTEGDTHNGGGSFVVRGALVKWEPDTGMGLGMGEIGSPLLPPGTLSGLGGIQSHGSGHRGF